MSNPVDVQIGRQIRNLRMSKSISEEALASQIGVTSQQVRKYERGISRASLSRLVRIAEVFGIPVSTLFDGLDGPAAGNDNTPGAEMVARQGLQLLKLFHSIQDPALRQKALQSVQEIVSAEGARPPDN